MRRIIFTLTVAILCSFVFATAQNNDSSKKQNIFESLAETDSVTQAKVTFHQDKRIEQIFTEKKSTSSSHTNTVGSGYRVQVFSSNVQRTAKAEAFKIEKDLKDVFPEQAIYVNYTSPFWKVRVGDFKSIEDAQEFRNQLIKVFPHLRSETYTVRDQINM
jgi:uncharacterized membrane protein YraQ (UPF0718 family)